MGVAIVGLPRSGKSFLAKCLSKEWGMPVFDTDVEIEAVSGLTCHNFFLQNGEAAFRALELVVLQRAPRKCILATGGGTVILEEARGYISRYKRVIYLNPPIHVIEKRIQNLPMPVGFLGVRELHTMRHPLYMNVATEVWSE